MTEIHIYHSDKGSIHGVVNDSIATILDVYTEPSHRNNGIATKLINEFMISAAKLGALCVELDDCSDNYKKPNNLYIKCGFRYIYDNGPEMQADLNKLIVQ